MSDDGLRPPDELHAEPFAIVPESLLTEKSDVVKLYALLDRYARKDRRLWPGQAELAERMACSDRHIRRLLARLEAVGLLHEVKRRYNGSTVYRLLRVPPDAARNPGPGSPQRPDCTVQVTPTDRTGESTLSGLGSPPKESHLREPKKARGLPSDFTVSPVLREWAKEKVPSVDIDAETEMWKDHHLAKGSTFKDWNAAWRKWMQTAVKFQASGNGSAPPVHVSRPFAERRAEMERQREERRAAVDRMVSD